MFTDYKATKQPNEMLPSSKKQEAQHANQWAICTIEQKGLRFVVAYPERNNI